MGSNPTQSIIKISDDAIGEYLTLLELRGVTKRHKKEVQRYLLNYRKYILSTIDKTKSMEYFKKLFKENALAYYKRQMYQIRKFLTYLKVDWAKDIVLPSDPVYYPKRISRENIEQTVSYFEGHRNHEQLKAVVLLGASSGLRAEEIYQLEKGDINLENRTIFINHNPLNGQTTKTKQSRVSFFNEDAQKHLSDYFNYFENNSVV